MKRFKLPLQFLLVLSVIAYACTERIGFDFGNIESKLVIDGFITDSLKSHSIRLSYTTELAEPILETDAEVHVKDDLGTSYLFTHTGNGIYRSDAFAADEARSYKLFVSTSEELYETDFEGLPKRVDPDFEISFEAERRPKVSGNQELVDELGARVFGTVFREGEPVYYQWLIEHWFIAEAYRALAPWKRFCYVKDFDVSRVVLSADLPEDGQPNLPYEVEIDFIPISPKTKQEFVVSIRRLLLSESSYQYWSKIEEQVQNVGSLFDTAPTKIYGNVFNANTAEPTLGYFGVYRESFGRLYFNDLDLTTIEREYDCIPPPRMQLADTANSCEDCLFTGAEFTQRAKPEWWR